MRTSTANDRCSPAIWRTPAWWKLNIYYTDGEVWILRLVEACQKRTGPVAVIPSPLATEIKDQIWQAIAGTMRN